MHCHEPNMRCVSPGITAMVARGAFPFEILPGEDRLTLTRNPETEIYPNECDPDSFFRQMYNENLLDMYFERSKRRF